jgi:soluble lytic murein transglycosylase-like protein
MQNWTWRTGAVRLSGMARRKAKDRSLDFVPGWAKVLALLCAPLLLLNGAVAFFGSSLVFPLSPFFLKEKVEALRLYAVHRAGCLFRGHGPLDGPIARAEARHGLPPGLLSALVEVESNGHVHRISPAGAMGPGQLMAGTARQLGVGDPFDPATALDGSARYLATQLRARKDVQLAVASYNAGPGNVRRVVPRNGETEFYVKKVLAAWERCRPRPITDEARANRERPARLADRR